MNIGIAEGRAPLPVSMPFHAFVVCIEESELQRNDCSTTVDVGTRVLHVIACVRAHNYDCQM